MWCAIVTWKLQSSCPQLQSICVQLQVYTCVCLPGSLSTLITYMSVTSPTDFIDACMRQVLLVFSKIPLQVVARGPYRPGRQLPIPGRPQNCWSIMSMMKRQTEYGSGHELNSILQNRGLQPFSAICKRLTLHPFLQKVKADV